MKRKEDIKIDDLKDKVNEEVGQFIDDKVAEMLSYIKQYRSEEDYWFVKYYEDPSFVIFAMGLMACEVAGMRSLYEPGQDLSEEFKKEIQHGLEMFTNKDVLKIFEGREELAVYLFLFGAYQRYRDFEAES